MKLEDLTKLRELFEKKYICISLFDKILDGKINIEKHFKPISNMEILHSTNNYVAVSFFEELVQNFINFLKEKNIDDTSFQIYIEPYYYINNKNFNNENEKVTSISFLDFNQNILKGVVDLGLYIGANMPNLSDKDKDEYLHKFVGTPFKVVNYDEFASLLISHGYNIKCKTFEELISLDKECSYEDAILLTDVKIEKEKTLEKKKIS